MSDARWNRRRATRALGGALVAEGTQLATVEIAEGFVPSEVFLAMDLAGLTDRVELEEVPPANAGRGAKKEAANR